MLFYILGWISLVIVFFIPSFWIDKKSDNPFFVLNKIKNWKDITRGEVISECFIFFFFFCCWFVFFLLIVNDFFDYNKKGKDWLKSRVFKKK